MKFRVLVAGLAVCVSCFAGHARAVTQSMAGVSVSVLDYGAKCDGVTDDSQAFYNALNAVPAGATVTVPAQGGSAPAGNGDGSPIQNGGGCLVSTNNGLFGDQKAVDVKMVHLVGLGTGAAIKCVDRSTQHTSCVTVEDGGVNNLNNNMTSIEDLSIYGAGNQSSSTDLVTLTGGNNMHAHNLVIAYAGEHGFSIDSYYNDGWVESALVENVRVFDSGGDNFHVQVFSGCDNCFVTQTTFINDTSRDPKGYALYLGSDNNTGVNKISDLQWIGGELDCTNSTKSDCVELDQQSTGGQPLEDILFQNVAIEDDGAAISGYAVGTHKVSGGSPMGPVTLQNAIYYGENAGGLNTADIGSWYADFCGGGNWNCHGQNTLAIQANGGLQFQNQTSGGAPSGNANFWLPVQINGVTRYIPAW